MDAIQAFRKRRKQRLESRFGKYNGGFRLDADDEDESNNGGGNKNHGNTRIPYGLCKREGIEVGKDWTPKDAWEALEGKGYSASSVYKELKNTGKVPEKPKEPEKPKMDVKQANKIIREYKAKKKDADALIDERDRMKLDANFAARQKEYIADDNTRITKEIEEIEKEHGKRHEMSPEVREQYDVLHEKLRLNNKKWHQRDEEEKAARAKADELNKQFERKFQEWKDYKGEYNKAILTKFPTYDDCKTKKDATDRLKACEYFDRNENTSFGRLTVEAARDLGKTFDDFFSKMPEMKGKLGYPEVKALRGYWGLSWPPPFSKVALDYGAYSNPEKFEKECKRAAKIGFHPAGTTRKSVLYHEYSHQIDYYLGKLLGDKTGVRKGTISTAILSEVIENLEKSGSKLFEGIESRVPDGINEADKRSWLLEEKKKIVKTSVSEYAYSWKGKVHKDANEFFAEAYCEYLDSENPREVAREVGKVTDKYLRMLGVR